MAKLSIHQAAERDANRAAASHQNDKLARRELSAAYARAVTRYAQEIDNGDRCAWASLARDELAANDSHPLIVELRGWLRAGRQTEPQSAHEYNRFTGVPIRRYLTPKVTNETWIKALFIDDDEETAAIGDQGGAVDGAESQEMRLGSTGTAFDQMDVFTFEEAARALVFSQTGRYAPVSINPRTPIGSAYLDWLNVLMEADSAGKLMVAVFEGDQSQRHHICRESLMVWCEARGMRPAFLFGAEVCQAANQTGTTETGFPYTTPELVALCAATKEFSERMQSATPPKKAEVVARLMALGVSSESLAQALDTVIRPKRHRTGGQKKTAV